MRIQYIVMVIKYLNKDYYYIHLRGKFKMKKGSSNRDKNFYLFRMKSRYGVECYIVLQISINITAIGINLTH